MKHPELIAYLSKIILQIKKNHPIRVGIDGVDASGKTYLANALAMHLEKQNITVIKASMDGFHNQKSYRYQQGENSPRGYYYDSFNNKAVLENLLIPLGENGNLQYKSAIFDFKTNSQISVPHKTADKNTVFIMDGVFLFRPELVAYWDLKIFLDVSFETTIARAMKRDGYLFGTEQEILHKYNQRYIPGQQLYFQDAHPQRIADIVIDNNDFGNPVILGK